MLGLIGAALLSRSMTTLLFNVQPTDPAVYAAVSLVLIAVALLASYLPARRAARIDPLDRACATSDVNRPLTHVSAAGADPVSAVREEGDALHGVVPPRDVRGGTFLRNRARSAPPGT